MSKLQEYKTFVTIVERRNLTQLKLKLKLKLKLIAVAAPGFLEFTGPPKSLASWLRT